MDERIKGRKNFPTKEVDPNNFIEDEEIKTMVKNIDNIKFNQEDYYKVYNCVHCGECETEEERITLKQKFLKDGNTVEGLDQMIECFEKFRTPYPSDKMRIKKPKEIAKNSTTLFFMGCLSTIRIPRYTEHALQYLLKQKIDFTILDKEICCGWPWFASGSMREFEICKKENIEIFKKFDKVICLCPACYFLFNKFYKPAMDKDIRFDYVADYLKPSKDQKQGRVGVQHLCQLINRGREGVDKFVDKILKKSGYKVIDVPHWCCGGGLGYMHRTDLIEAIANKRMTDFDREDIDYITTYCVSCWWILKRFSKLSKIKPKAVDLFELIL
ncbi:MAG: heterodisulfide reductase-related iron-sulfur binding cluster [Candidatus Odinarchaeota archaeon]